MTISHFRGKRSCSDPNKDLKENLTVFVLFDLAHMILALAGDLKKRYFGRQKSNLTL